MESQKNRTIGIWKYIPMRGGPALICLNGSLLTRQGKWSETIIFTLDTGYDGEVLLTTEIFNRAGLDMLTSNHQQKYQTVTGDLISLQNTISQLKLGKEKYEVTIETHKHAVENIIGRSFLNRFYSLLDGYQEQIEIQEIA